MFNSTELFCVIDDFFLKFEAIYWQFLKQNRDPIRTRTAQLIISEICFIAIWYKYSYFNNFKTFFAWLKKKTKVIYLSTYFAINVCSALSNGHVADIKMVEQLVYGLEAKILKSD